MFGAPIMLGDTLGSLGFPFQPFGSLGMGIGLQPGGLGTDFYGAGAGAVDWRNDPRWRQLPDSNRVFFNPNIDDTIWRPRADIFDESRNLVRVEFELPGVPAEDIDLSVVNNVITVAALKPQTRKEEGGAYFQRERHFGRFFRALQLPFTVDPKAVHANLDHGVLKVVLTKTGGALGGIPITITSSGLEAVRPSSSSSLTSGLITGGQSPTPTTASTSTAVSPPPAGTQPATQEESTASESSRA
jgi:HSP20 family molecular chaperone IbpA